MSCFAVVSNLDLTIVGDLGLWCFCGSCFGVLGCNGCIGLLTL